LIKFKNTNYQGYLMNCKTTFVLFFLFFRLTACANEDTLKIGFIANLSGRTSDVGIDARNATLMATDEINNKGGINGKKIELFIKDDQNNADTAKIKITELIDQKVIAVIGHIMSGMSLVSLPIINERKVLMISPTSVSNVFNEKDDYFFRTSPATKHALSVFADFAYHKLKLKKIAFIYDLSNKGYSEDWYNNFKHKFENLGGKTSNTLTFNSQDKPHFNKLAIDLLASKPDAVAIVSGAIDAALLSQNIRKISPKTQLLICGWAMTEELLTNGGKSLDGAIISYNFDRESQMPEYLAFKENYKKRFGINPNFAAKYSYETVYLLAEILNQVKVYTADTLKNAIITQKHFKGLQGDIMIDNFGDAMVKIFFFTVKDGAFKKID
jgi:branched-chain amino acid transport system substrate-binding protein